VRVQPSVLLVRVPRFPLWLPLWFPPASLLWGVAGGDLGESGLGLFHRGALRRLGAEQSHDDVGERASLFRRHDLAGGDPVQQQHRVVAHAGGWRALDRRVQGGAERVHVGGERDLLALGHFGGQVGGGADERARGRPGDVLDHPGHSEISDLHGVVVTHEQVRRLDVAVHDPGRVRGGERGGSLGTETRDLPIRQPTAVGEYL
jgi:hypothetical protein